MAANRSRASSALLIRAVACSCSRRAVATCRAVPSSAQHSVSVFKRSLVQASSRATRSSGWGATASPSAALRRDVLAQTPVSVKRCHDARSSSRSLSRSLRARERYITGSVRSVLRSACLFNYSVCVSQSARPLWALAPLETAKPRRPLLRFVFATKHLGLSFPMYSRFGRNGRERFWGTPHEAAYASRSSSIPRSSKASTSSRYHSVSVHVQRGNSL